jgi:hypothetical protein
MGALSGSTTKETASGYRQGEPGMLVFHIGPPAWRERSWSWSQNSAVSKGNGSRPCLSWIDHQPIKLPLIRVWGRKNPVILLRGLNPCQAARTRMSYQISSGHRFAVVSIPAFSK